MYVFEKMFNRIKYNTCVIDYLFLKKETIIKDFAFHIGTICEICLFARNIMQLAFVLKTK